MAMQIGAFIPHHVKALLKYFMGGEHRRNKISPLWLLFSFLLDVLRSLQSSSPFFTTIKIQGAQDVFFL